MREGEYIYGAIWVGEQHGWVPHKWTKEGTYDTLHKYPTQLDLIYDRDEKEAKKV